MATGVEAAATLVSIIGFSAQIFDGCVKGFVLLSTARNLGRDADLFRCMLDWEHFRLEQWAQRVSLHDPKATDTTLDWTLIKVTLEHLDHLLNDTRAMKLRYNLELEEEAPLSKPGIPSELDDLKPSRFKELFALPGKHSSSAAAKVVQSNNSVAKKLRWAAIDKNNFEKLIQDISQLTHRLLDALTFSLQAQLHTDIESMLQEARLRSGSALDQLMLQEFEERAELRQKSAADAQEQEARETKKRLNNDFFYAINHNRLEEVETLIEKGADVHGLDFCGWPPLVRAAEKGNVDIAKLLVQRGADPLEGTAGQRLPTHFAAEEGHVEVLKLLLDHGVDPNLKDYLAQTALHKASRTGQERVARLLLSLKDIQCQTTDSSGWTPLLSAVARDSKSIARTLLEHPEVDPNARIPFSGWATGGQTPLWMAVSRGDEMIEMLLERAEIEVNKPNAKGETPLHHAVRENYGGAVRMLLEEGRADPNVCDVEGRSPLSVGAVLDSPANMQMLLARHDTIIDLKDRHGETPLVRAAYSGSIQSIRLLLAHGADVNALNAEGRTPLALAALQGFKVVAKTLLKGGANINLPDKKGNTPLSLAAESNHDTLVRLLLSHRADANLTNEDEETPFEKAQDRHFDEILTIFREFKISR